MLINLVTQLRGAYARRRQFRRRPLKVATLLLCLGAVALAPASAEAAGNFANAGLSGASTSNPLAGMKWGVYRGSLDGLYSAWQSAHGEDKKLLAKEALEPLMYWFGSWNQDSLAANTASQYIQAVQNGNPNALVQMAIFRLVPWEKQACQSLPTAEDVASYKDWVDNWAQGIGTARVAMDLQPDLPFEGCIPSNSLIPAQELSYAAQKFSALPHTTVYIDAGAGDWQTVSAIASELRESGVQYTRGFALGATHYESTGQELAYGREVVRALAADGIPNMHFIINTAQNGKPYTTQQDPKQFSKGNVCISKQAQHCVTLGVSPTPDVTADDKKLGLNARQDKIAAQYCDGYLWFGRPWLKTQKGPFLPQRALQMARTTPF